ncbi:MAG: hypothetical protein ABR936_12010 [Bacteroidota bacterium]|jgi:hypothetical protein
MKKPKHSRDINQLAKSIVALATREATEEAVEKKNPHAVALGRMGGLIGGKARARKLSATRRKKIAQHAAKVRWRTRKAKR